MEETVSGADLKVAGQLLTWDREQEAWKDQAMEILKFVAATCDEFTCDDVRGAILSSGMSEPHHPNVWGSLLRTGGRRGICRKTGEYRKSATLSRHAGMVAVWTAVPPEEGDSGGEEEKADAGTQLEIRAAP